MGAEAPFPGARRSRPASVASERSPLLAGPYTHTRRREEDEESDDYDAHYVPQDKLWLSRLSFGIATFCAYASLGLFVLTGISSVHSSLAAVLPTHRSSTFLPLWLSFLSFVTAMLHLLYFAHPSRSPHGSAKVLNAASTVLLLADLLIITLTREIRYKEAMLTILIVSIALFTHAHATFRPFATPRKPSLPALLPRDAIVHDHREPLTRGERIGHFFKTTLSLATITFPLFIIHLLIFLALFAITANLCLRSYDSSLRPPGNMWLVNPYTGRNTGLVDRVGITGRGTFRVHLLCEGGNDYDGRTILFEGPASRPGSISGQWIDEVAEHQKHSNATVRVCRWDRPG